MRDEVRYAVGLDSTVDRLVEAKTAPLREALQGLVDRLDEIAANDEFKSVWTLHYVHGGVYRGPNWVDALERARAALNEAMTEPTKSG